MTFWVIQRFRNEGIAYTKKILVSELEFVFIIFRKLFSDLKLVQKGVTIWVGMTF